jgi:hypothetical protein
MGLTPVSRQQGQKSLAQLPEHLSHSSTIAPEPSAVDLSSLSPWALQWYDIYPTLRRSVKTWPLPSLTEVHDVKRPYVSQFQWVAPWVAKPEWAIPISSGLDFEALVNKMPPALRSELIFLFGPDARPTHWVSTEANARRYFYRSLNHNMGAYFRGMIHARKLELRGVAAGHLDPQLQNLSTPKIPTVRLMLYHLMEAVEAPPGIPHLPPIQAYNCKDDYSTYMKMYWSQFQGMTAGLRSTSAPNLGQQPESSGYFDLAVLLRSFRVKLNLYINGLTDVLHTDTSAVAAAAQPVRLRSKRR